MESIAPVLRWKEQGERPDWKVVSDKSPTLKCYWSQWDMLAVKEGVLVKRWESDDGKEFKCLLVLPRSLRKQALDMLHSSKTAGHLGREKTMPKVRERYYWVGMSADVRSYLRQCVVCAQKKGTPKKHRAPLQQLRVGGPLERIAIEVLGPLTETHRGNVYILVVGDYWTKWMEAYPIPDQQAETVASKLVEEFVCRFGVPTELHSDQGRNFESGVFQEMCKILGIRKTRTTPYNPKSDGLVERYNRTIVNAVSLMILPQHSQRDWDEYVPFVGMAYRSSVQASTGETPNMLMLGRDVATPIDLMFTAPPKELDCDTDYAEELREKIRGMHERARYALHISSRRQKRFYDRKVCGPVYREGQFVWLFRVVRKASLSRKLMLPWEGPYQVVKVLSDVTYRIQKTSRSKPQVVHADRLKPYEGPELKAWTYVAPESVEQVEMSDKEKNHASKVQELGENEEKGKGKSNQSLKSTSDSNSDDEIIENKERVKCSGSKIDEIGVKDDSVNQGVQGIGSNESPLRRRNPLRLKRKPSRYDC